METRSQINNDIYHELGPLWHKAQDNPVALLRQEANRKNPWVWEEIQNHFLQTKDIKILDVGCGAGFLSNYLAQKGLTVTGLDVSSSSLEMARLNDQTSSVNYIKGDALDLPFESCSFNVVASMDFLEHVEEPAEAIRESARVLKPGGLFFFHTFNRNLLSYLIIIKGMEWFVKNTPPNLHILRLFIKPTELDRYCSNNGLKTESMKGIRPRFDRNFFQLLKTGKVSEGFDFKFTNSLKLGYLGFAKKQDVENKEAES